MKTLGIKFEVAGVKEAQAALSNLKNNLNQSLQSNKRAVIDSVAVARSDTKRADLIEKTNQRIFFSYLGLRANIRNQTEGIVDDTNDAIKKQQRILSRSISDFFVEKFGTKSQKQNLIIREERRDFVKRSTYKGLDTNARNTVLETRLLFKELVLDLKKLVKEDLKQVLEETVGEVTEKESSFSKMTSIATAPFKIAAAGIMSPINAIIFGALNQIGAEMTTEFGEGVASQMQKNLGLQFRELGQDIGGAVGSSMYLAYEKIMTATRNSVIDRHPVSGSNETLHLQKLMDDLGQILQGFALSLAAIPIKVKKRIDLDKKAIPLVKEMAGELMINRKLTQAQEDQIVGSKSITVLTGGANGDPEAGTTDFAYRTLQPMLRGSYVHPVKNLFSNAQGSEEFDRVFGSMLSFGMKNDTAKSELLEFARNNLPSEGEQSLSDEELEGIFAGDSEEVSKKITDFFKKIHIPLPKILEVVLKGYNPDDIMLAAEGIFFKEKYPDKPLQFVGTSFGGFNAAGGAELMNRMGYEDVKAVGVTTPLVGMESTVNPDNYFSSIGDLDFLYEMTLGGIFKDKVPKPDNLQVVPGKGKGHLLGHFLGQSSEFRNALQHFLKGRVDVPSMEEYSGKEVMAMGRIPGNNAESAIARTIKKNLGEAYDDGYMFNVDDLIGHRDHLVTMAGGKDLKKIKNTQLKEFYQDYIEFLDTLAEELETIEKFRTVGKKFKPINSLRKAANFYPDLGHFIPKHPDFGMNKDEFNATNAEVENNKNLVAFKRKISNESPNIERTYRAILGEDITEKGYGYYDEKEYQVRANEHLSGLIGYLENDLLGEASDSEKQAAQPYLELLKKLKETILQVGGTGNLNTSEIVEAERLLGISLKEYKSVIDKNPTLNVKERKTEIQAAAAKAKQGNKKQTVKEVRPELEAYIWAINQELIREGKQQIDINTAEYLGSGYKNHAIKANGQVYKFARHTNPLATKVNKMLGKKKESYKGEIAALKKLQGENAPKFMAGGEEFMAMEEAQGMTLKEALETASPEERRELLKKAGKLLKSFHKRGVAHFDFHPGNIIKQNDGNLVAIDWEASKVTKNKQQHYYDRELAVDRFQDVISSSMRLESKEDVAMMFDDAYYGKPDRVQVREEARRTQQQIINRYNDQLNQIIERAGQQAEEAINSNVDLNIDVETAYGAIRDRMSKYRNAVELGLFEQARQTGELILRSSEYLKRIFNQSGDNRRGQLTRVQNEILRGDRGAGRSPTPLAELFYQTDQVQLQLDLWDDTADGARQSLSSEAGQQVGSEFAEGIIDGAEDELDIQSPSKVFQWIGEMVRAGFNGGVAGIGEFLHQSLTSAAENSRESIYGVAESVSNVAQQLGDSQGLLDPLLQTEGADETVNDFFGDLIEKASSLFDDLKEKYPILGRISDFLGSIAGDALQAIGIFSLGESLIGFSTAALAAAMQMESLERSIISVSNSAADGANNIRFVRDEARRLSIDLVAAEEAYKRILGATSNTPLEGLQTQQLFSTLATTARNRGLNTDATNRLFLGFEQVIAKGEFKSEEVRGQLSEVLGDIQNLLATSVGVPISQLDELMEAGSLKAPEVMPKLVALLNAQNAAVGETANTAQAAQTRFNNAILEYQDAVGRQLQPVQKLGLNSLASALEVLRNNSTLLIKLIAGLFTTVLTNLTIKLLATKLATFALAEGIYRLIGLLVSAPFLTFAAQFALMTTAIEVWTNNIKLAKNAFPELEDRVEASTKRLEALRKAFDDTGEAANNFGENQPKQLQLNEGLELPEWLQGIAGGERLNWDNLARNKLQSFDDAATEKIAGFYEFIGAKDYADKYRQDQQGKRIITQAQKKQADFVVETGDLIGNIDSTLLYSPKAKTTLEDIAKIDARARDLQSQTMNVSAGDSAGLKKALEAEAKVLKERDELQAKTAQYQESLQSDLQDAKDTLKDLEQLDNTGGKPEEIQQRENLKKTLEDRISLLEAEKKAIDDIVSRIPKFLSEVNRLLRNSDERVRGFIGNQGDDAVVNRTEAIKEALVQGLSDAELELKLDNLSATDLEDRIQLINKEIKSLEDKLGNAYIQEGVAGLERAAKKDGLELTPETLERMLTEGRGSQENEAANILLKLDEYQSILAEAESGLVDLIKGNQGKLKDFNKTISDYFSRVTQQLKEATLETQRLLSEIFYTDIKNKLRGAVAPGSNTFMSGVIENIQSVLDQAGQLAGQAFDNISAELSLEIEMQNLVVETQEFIKQIGSAGDALQEFVGRLNGNLPKNKTDKNQPDKAASTPKPQSPPKPTPSITQDSKVYQQTVEQKTNDYITKVLKQPAGANTGVQELLASINKTRPQEFITASGVVPVPQNPVEAAQNLTGELETRKRVNLGLQKYQTQQQGEAFQIEADNAIETNKRQIDQGLKESNRSLLGFENTFADLKSQYDFPSASNELEKALRDVKVTFIDTNSDIDTQILDLTDNIKTITKFVNESSENISKLQALGTPGALKSVEVIKSGVSKATEVLPSLQKNLDKLTALKNISAETEKQGTQFTEEQGALKVKQEGLIKASNLLQIKSNIAAQRGTIEQRRQLNLEQEENRLDQAIAGIELNEKPENRQDLIDAERRQSQINKENINFTAQTEELDLERLLIDMDAGINDKKAGFLSRVGFNFKADKLRKDSAVAQENNRYQKELVEWEKKYKDQPDKLAEFKAKAIELNRVNLEGINQQFKSLKTTIEDLGISAIQGFFQNVATNFFDGKAEQDRAYMEERLRYAEELVQLENQHKEEPGHLAHLKNRARELNEQKLDKIKSEFNGFKRVISIAGQALLEFTKQLAAMAAQYAAAKFISSIFKSTLNGVGGGGGATAFNASEGITVGDIRNYRTGGSIKSRIVPTSISKFLARNNPNIARAFRAEGEGAQLGVFHTGEELLSRKTGEAGVYQALKRRLGFNPLQQLVSNYAQGGTVDVNSNILSGISSVRPRIDLSGLSEVRSQRSEVRKTVNVHTTVVTKDADSFRLNQDQMNQDLVERMRRGI